MFDVTRDVADGGLAREAFHMALAPRDKQALRRIGDNVVAERSRRRLTQEQVASAADISLSTVQRIEDGDTDPGMSKYVRVADAIGVPLADLVGDLGPTRE